MPLDFTPSDIFLTISAALAVAFFLTFAAGGGWWRVSKYGWVGVMTFLHSLSVAALLFLIVWGIVFGQRVEEFARLPIAVFLALALVAKIVILHIERRRGRILRREHTEKESHDSEQVPGGPAPGRDAVPGGLPGRAHGWRDAD